MAQKLGIDHAFAGVRAAHNPASPDRRRTRRSADVAHAGGTVELGTLPIDIQRAVQTRITAQTGTHHSVSRIRVMMATGNGSLNASGPSWQETDRRNQRSFTFRFFLYISPAIAIIAAFIVLA